MADRDRQTSHPSPRVENGGSDRGRRAGARVGAAAFGVALTLPLGLAGPADAMNVCACGGGGASPSPSDDPATTSPPEETVPAPTRPTPPPAVEEAEPPPPEPVYEPPPPDPKPSEHLALRPTDDGPPTSEPQPEPEPEPEPELEPEPTPDPRPTSGADQLVEELTSGESDPPPPRNMEELLLPRPERHADPEPTADREPEPEPEPSSSVDRLMDELENPQPQPRPARDLDELLLPRDAPRDAPPPPELPESDGVITADELPIAEETEPPPGPPPLPDDLPPGPTRDLARSLTDPTPQPEPSPYLSDLLLPGVDLGDRPPPEAAPREPSPVRLGTLPTPPPGQPGPGQSWTDVYLRSLTESSAPEQPVPTADLPDLSHLDPIEQDEAVLSPLMTPFFGETDREAARERLETDQLVRDGLLSPEDDPDPERDEFRASHAPPPPRAPVEDENGWDHAHDSVSGFTNELTFGLVDFGGNEDSGYYKGGRGASYIPWNPASAVKSLGTGVVKGTARLFGREAAEETGERAVREGTEEAGERVTREAGEELSETAARNADETIPAPRPSWQASELRVADDLAEQGYEAQRSFIGGQPARYGQKGSSRPDFVAPNPAGPGVRTVEVKNYVVGSAAGRSRLVRNIAAQSAKGERNLPAGSVQSFVMDIRGQTISRDQLADLVDAIVARSGGRLSVSDVSFIVGG